jgi:hypothetical protein
MPRYTLAARRPALRRRRRVLAALAPVVKRQYRRRPTAAYYNKGRGYPRVRGRGGFWGDLWSGIKKATPAGFFSQAGSALGGAFGGPVGGNIGSALGGGLSKLLGFGAYACKQNSLCPGSGNRTQAQVPAMHSAETGIRVVHKEYLCDITSSVAFSNQQVFNINPGLADSFPWLSQIAEQFEEYQPNGIVYYFRATAGDAISSTNNALGTVIMACDYNPINNQFENKISMENTMWSTSGKPSNDNMLPIECGRGENPLQTLWVRNGSQPANTDLRLYDVGVAQVATQGQQTGSVDIGEHWVSYDFTLKKPIIDPTPSGGINPTIHTTHLVNTHSVSTSNYFGTNPNTNIVYTSFPIILGQVPVVFGPTYITLAAGMLGNFCCAVDWVGGATGCVIPSITPSGSAKALNIGLANSTSIDNGSADWAPGTLSTTSTAQMINYYFSMSDPTTQGVLTFGGGTLPTSATVDVKIFPLDPNWTL